MIQSYEVRNQNITRFFAELKRKPDSNEPRNRTRNERGFETLYYRFIQAYVENYAQLFSEGMISKHYGFTHNFNPALSTTVLPERASCYASGVRMNNGHYLNPHYRRFTLKPKHPCVGVVYAYAIDLVYFFQNGCFILDHLFNNRLSIDYIKQFEYEVMFESIIPGKYQVDRELFIFPSLSEWSNLHATKFGYTNITLSHDRSDLISLPSDINGIDKKREFLKKVNDRVRKN